MSHDDDIKIVEQMNRKKEKIDVVGRYKIMGIAHAEADRRESR